MTEPHLRQRPTGLSWKSQKIERAPPVSQEVQRNCYTRHYGGVIFLAGRWRTPLFAIGLLHGTGHFVSFRKRPGDACALAEPAASGRPHAPQAPRRIGRETPHSGPRLLLRRAIE